MLFLMVDLPIQILIEGVVELHLLGLILSHPLRLGLPNLELRLGLPQTTAPLCLRRIALFLRPGLRNLQHNNFMLSSATVVKKINEMQYGKGWRP